MKSLYLNEVDSTNNYVKTNIENLEDRTVVYTSHQTNGRGRFNRQWIDTGSENIYMTFCLKPSDEMQEVYSNITQYLSVSVCRVLKKYGVNPKIKWPNDVLVNNKKITGILAETVFEGKIFKGIALGVGINLNTPQFELDRIDKPATSVFVEIGKNIDKNEVLKCIYDEFFNHYDEFLLKGFGFIKNDYMKYFDMVGKDINIDVFGTIHSGCITDINDKGALILEKNKKQSTFYMGDIL